MKEYQNGVLTIQGEGRYLWIPVCRSEQKAELFIESEDITLFRFVTPKLENVEDICYFGGLKIEDKTVKIHGEFSKVFFDNIKVSDESPSAASVHPAIHFAAVNGWINDPNGLIYNDGMYHLFFQYNPVDMVWQNMTWGHAVSRDLLHWEQLDDAMYPDEKGAMFSGSAIKNYQGHLGLPKDALLFFYTVAGSSSEWSKNQLFIQGVAYSMDNGKTLIKMDKPRVEHMVGENRDPKVYWYPEKELYYMALYLDGDDFVILNSKDMSDFQVTQHLAMKGTGECPDLRKIPCDDGTTQWVFMQADGGYYVGDFDGSTFTPKTSQQSSYATYLQPYAAQTFNEPDDRIIHVAFLKTESNNCTYTNMISLPRELSLAVTQTGYELRMKPVQEYFESRRITENTTYSYEQKRAVEVEISLETENFIKLFIGELMISYDKTTGKLCCDTKEIDFGEKHTELHILIDKGMLEISSESYIRPAWFAVDENKLQGKISVVSGEMHNITYYEIR